MDFKTNIILPSTVDRKVALQQLRGGRGGKWTVSLWDMKPLLKLIRLKQFKKLRKRLLEKQTRLLKMRDFFQRRGTPLDKVLVRLYSRHISSNEDALNRAHQEFHSPLCSPVSTQSFTGMSRVVYFFQHILKCGPPKVHMYRP